MFRFTQEPSSGSCSSAQLKLQVWFHCAFRCVRYQCSGVICRQNTDNPHIDKHSGTIPVILAGH